MALTALPQRQRRAPVSGARQRPVDVVAQPFPVPAVLDRRWLPAGPLVLGQQLGLDLGGADEPGRQRIVEQRRGAPPAVRGTGAERLAAARPAALGEGAGQW